MNKNYHIFLVALIAVFTLTSCATEKETVKTTDADQTNEVEAKPVSINLESSLITWNGYKSLIDTEHEGTIQLSEGEFLVDTDLELVGGNFTIDMSTLDNTDLSGGGREGLLNDLRSDNFFDVENHPTGKFEITKVMPIQENGYTHQISGNLTLKETTKNITFKSNITGLDSDNNIQATADFNIDRQLWNIGHSNDQSVLDEIKNNALQDEVRVRLDIQS